MLGRRSLERWLVGDVLGLVVGDRHFEASLVREGIEVWAGAANFDDGDSFAAVLRGLLATAPVRVLARRRAHVVFSAARAPTKVLPGVSATVAERDPSLVRSVPERYFLCVPGTVEMSALWVSPSSDVWATAFSRMDIDDVRTVLSELGWPAWHIASEAARILDAETHDPSPSPMLIDQAYASERAKAVAREVRAIRPAAMEAPSVRGGASSRGVTLVTMFIAALLAGFAGAEYAALRLDVELNDRNSSAFNAVKRTRDSIDASVSEAARLAEFVRAHPSVLVQMHAVSRAVDSTAQIERWMYRDSLIDLSLVAANGAVLPASLSTIAWVRDAWLVGGITRNGTADDTDRIVLRLLVRSEIEPLSRASPAPEARSGGER